MSLRLVALAACLDGMSATEWPGKPVLIVSSPSQRSKSCSFGMSGKGLQAGTTFINFPQVHSPIALIAKFPINNTQIEETSIQTCLEWEQQRPSNDQEGHGRPTAAQVEILPYNQPFSMKQFQHFIFSIFSVLTSQQFYFLKGDQGTRSGG